MKYWALAALAALGAVGTAAPEALATQLVGVTVADSTRFPGFPPDTPPASAVLVPGDLPRGALAIVQVRPQGIERTYVILSERHVTDRLMMRAHLQPTVYAYRHPEDTGSVEFWLFPDGTVEIRSAERGVEIGSHVPVAESVRGDEHLSKGLFKNVAAIKPADFPGFGLARVIEWAKVSE